MIGLAVAATLEGPIACLASNALLVLGLMSVLWVASVYLRDASIVDPWWSVAFLIVGLNTAMRTGLTAGKALLLALLAVWALRLWAHLHARSRGKAEDPRYAKFRADAGPRWWWLSFFQVFLLQGGLVLIVSAPLQVALSARAPDTVSTLDLCGLFIWLSGFLIESVADAQLQAFRSDPTRKGTILDSGLWRYSRHPNYFGEALLWWGYWLFALDQPAGLISIFGPALMTFLLVRVSGVTMLDAHMATTRPGYAAYMARTSGFFPLPPRNG